MVKSPNNIELSVLEEVLDDVCQMLEGSTLYKELDFAYVELDGIVTSLKEQIEQLENEIEELKTE